MLVRVFFRNVPVVEVCGSKGVYRGVSTVQSFLPVTTAFSSDEEDAIFTPQFSAPRSRDSIVAFPMLKTRKEAFQRF